MLKTNNNNFNLPNFRKSAFCFSGHHQLSSVSAMWRQVARFLRNLVLLSGILLQPGYIKT